MIDTNVAIVANGGHEAASDDCMASCIEALLAARSDVVLIDEQYRIFDEYRRYLSHAGQPGMGDAFFKWLWSNQANPSCCRQISITPHDERVFAEFPDDPDLDRFDRDDRKFVAVARASGESPSIVNASDTDWWIFRGALERHGVRTTFLCQELMTN